MAYPKTRTCSRSILALAIIVAACDDAASPDADGGPLDLRVCTTNWSVIFSPEQSVLGLPPTVLRWHEGRLLTALALETPPRVLSFPDTGGPATELLRDTSSVSFWTEGDRLLHASYGETMEIEGIRTRPLSLYSAPIAGGPSEVAVRLQARDRFTNQLLIGWALDREAIYWLRRDYVADGTQWSVWRASRNGGGDQQLAVLGVPDDGSLLDGRVDPLSDRLMVYESPLPYGGGPLGFSVPKGGGEARALPTWPGGKILGVGGDGAVLWQRYAGGFNGQLGSDRYEVGRAAPDGDSVQPAWPGKPRSAYPLAAWDDGRGGWYVSQWERGADAAIHNTIWSLAADGRAQRIACDPLVETSISAAVVGPDALYVVARYSNQYWEVVRIGRPADL